ncbi:MAG: hypothetical protein JSU93_04395 [Methanobacteriota archaeon]|nr:MAG: hypothetical protein JSU93_04395 [Euryarchaeota archaeon]
MSSSTLSPSDIARVRQHVRESRMTLSVVRSPDSPQQMRPLFEQVSTECSLSLVRVIASPLSDFGFAEFGSNGRTLVMLFIGGERTELVSVSETDEATLQDLEDSVSSSNFQSFVIRHGT